MPSCILLRRIKHEILTQRKHRGLICNIPAIIEVENSPLFFSLRIPFLESCNNPASRKVSFITNYLTVFTLKNWRVLSSLPEPSKFRLLAEELSFLFFSFFATTVPSINFWQRQLIFFWPVRPQEIYLIECFPGFKFKLILPFLCPNSLFVFFSNLVSSFRGNRLTFKDCFFGNSPAKSDSETKVLSPQEMSNNLILIFVFRKLRNGFGEETTPLSVRLRFISTKSKQLWCFPETKYGWH